MFQRIRHGQTCYFNVLVSGLNSKFNLLTDRLLFDDTKTEDKWLQGASVQEETELFPDFVEVRNVNC